MSLILNFFLHMPPCDSVRQGIMGGVCLTAIPSTKPPRGASPGEFLSAYKHYQVSTHLVNFVSPSRRRARDGFLKIH